MDAIRLTDADFEILLPGETVILGKTAVTIAPMDVDRISKLIKRCRAYLPMMQDEGLTWENMLGEKLDVLCDFVAFYAPELLGLLTGLHPADLARLPPGKLSELARVAVCQNITSLNDLEKNLKALLGTVQENLEVGRAVMATATGTLSRPSSATDTVGRISGDIPSDSAAFSSVLPSEANARK